MCVDNSHTERYVYPDITIVKADTMNFTDFHEDILLSQLAIIEILSKPTENYDITEKFDA